MNYNTQKLENGITLLTVPMQGLESVTVSVWVKAGSRYEEAKVNGVSHFLEHMVFKGSKKRPTAKEISQVVDSMGGEFNAATSKDWTNFYIKARAGHLETAMDVLSDMVLNPILDESEIEREKGTIIQEIAMYEDTPMMHVGDVFEGLAFEENSLGFSTAGTPESVKGMLRQDFLDFRNTHYYPENMIVSVVGGVPEEFAAALVRKYFQEIPVKNTSPVKFPLFETKSTGPLVKLQTKKVEQAHLILGFYSEGRNYEGRYAQSVLSAILGGGMSSRLWIQVRERRGLAYSVQTGMERYQEIGYFSTYGGVDVKRTDEAVKVMLNEVYSLADGSKPVDEEELYKAKEYLKGHLALALEDTKDVTNFFADQTMFAKKILTPEEVYKKIDDVDVDMVLSEAKKIFMRDKLRLAVIGPFEDADMFKKVVD